MRDRAGPRNVCWGSQSSQHVCDLKQRTLSSTVRLYGQLRSWLYRKTICKQRQCDGCISQFAGGQGDLDLGAGMLRAG